MDLRCYIDPETDQPHIYNHGVTEDEVAEALRAIGEDREGRAGSRVAIGRTRGGRIRRVIYAPDDDRHGAFVITAYDLDGKPLRAYRQRMRHRGQR